MDHKPTDYLSPSDDNAWMLDVAKKWIEEVESKSSNHDAGINIRVWSSRNPDAAFGVVQTILELTEHDPTLFDLASAGPLETFLVQCPDDFIEHVWKVASIDPRLRSAFGHVWQNGRTDARFLIVKSLAWKGE